MKKILSILLAVILIAPTANAQEDASEYIPVLSLDAEMTLASGFSPSNELPVRSAILIEQATGRVLYEQSADEKLPPASVTKIMTLLLVMEAIDSGKISLDDKVTTSDLAAGYGGSQIWLKPGEQMTVDELLKATAIASANDATIALAEFVAGSQTAFIDEMNKKAAQLGEQMTVDELLKATAIASANDATIALAEFVAGSQTAFIDEMNKKAAQLGMKNTTFKCAEGLDTEGHLTTARDIAIMSRELMKHELIKKYTTVWMDSLRGGQTQLVNTNRLIRFYDGATGLKTGTTSGAGSCLSATAERNGLGLVAVVMGAPTSDIRFASARSMLDWGFANYTSVKLEQLQHPKLPVVGGTVKSVSLKSTPPSGVVVEKNKASLIESQIELPESVPAPIKSGTELGRVIVRVDEQIVAEYPIVAVEDIEKMTFGKAFSMLLENLILLK